MNCELPPEVLRYIEAVEADTPRACPEQHALVSYVRRVFAEEDIYVDTEQLRHYLGRISLTSGFSPGRNSSLPCGIAPTAPMGAPGGKSCCAWWAVGQGRTALSPLIRRVRCLPIIR